MTEVEERPKNKRGRPINPERHMLDGSSYKGPNDKDYFRKYYHEKMRKEMTCAMCKQTVVVGSYSKHVLSKKCQKARTAGESQIGAEK